MLSSSVAGNFSIITNKTGFEGETTVVRPQLRDILLRTN
jgi:hypothetical protein